ncbi:hypothetical protein LTR49_023822 [Elasticomyces elasticus]|nr:hypothetical protein LTR49_023822 [Elasticomyces elasticus]
MGNKCKIVDELNMITHRVAALEAEETLLSKLQERTYPRKQTIDAFEARNLELHCAIAELKRIVADVKALASNSAASHGVYNGAGDHGQGGQGTRMFLLTLRGKLNEAADFTAAQEYSCSTCAVRMV